MKVNPYLTFPGTCREAMTHYEKVLGGKITAMMEHAGTPAAEHTEPDWQDKIIHARMVVGDYEIMASDAPPQMYDKPNGMMVTLSVETPADADRLYEQLSTDAETIHMAMQETFWAERFAMFTDRYGTPFMISCNKPHE